MDNAPLWLAIPLSLLFTLVLFDAAWRSASVVSWLIFGTEPGQQRRKIAPWGAFRVLLLAVITWGVGTFGLSYLPGVLNWVVAGTLVLIGIVAGVKAGMRRSETQPTVPSMTVAEKS